MLKINASKKPVVDVKGSFVTSDKKNANVTKITFKNMDTPDYTYTFDVSGKSYSVKSFVQANMRHLLNVKRIYGI